MTRVRVSPGASFARKRRMIGGTSGMPETDALLRSALGPEARLLTLDGPLVADADACFLSGEGPVVTTADWWRIIASDAFARVSGSFVVAWRAPTGGVALVRDAVGHRSLYYTTHAGRLVFASSLRVLLDVEAVPRTLAVRSVSAYLAYAYLPGRETMVEGAFELLPGERVTFDAGRVTRTRFWDLPAEPEGFAREEDLCLRLRRALEDTVAEQLPRDAPVAASLSGGIDSSLVVALAARLHGSPVHTFSITFGDQHADELPWSSAVAAHCGTRHTVVELPAEAILVHLDDTIACLDKPNGDPLTVPNALLFREMARHAPVALNGEGGDPCFGGPKNLPMVLSELYGEADEGERERSYLRAHQKCAGELEEMLTTDALAASLPPLENDLAPWFADARWSALVTRLMAINIRFKGGHHILPKVDALSSPFGVLARSPLFAKRIVELAFTIPPEASLRGSVEKALLKDAVRDLLPQEILDRPKSGMMVPVEAWFQGPLLAEARPRVLRLAETGLFRRSYLEGLLAGTLGGLRPRRGVKIWLLITLESHLRALGLTGRGEERTGARAGAHAWA